MQTKSFRLPKPLSDTIQQLAIQNDRSWNSQAIYLLKTHPDVKKIMDEEKNKAT